MAVYFRSLAGLQVQKACSAAAQRTFAVEFPATAESLTITVSKAGAALGATAGTTLTQISATLYKLVLHAGDLSALGDLAVKAVGATDTTVYTGLQVVDHNPYSALADVRQASPFGKMVADTADNTVKVYEADGTTLRGTATKSEAGTQTIWTP